MIIPKDLAFPSSIDDDDKAFIKKTQEIAYKILENSNINESKIISNLIEEMHYDSSDWYSYVITVSLDPSDTNKLNISFADAFVAERLASKKNSQNVIFRFSSGEKNDLISG